MKCSLKFFATIAAVAVFIFNGYSQTKVLFIGNSFTNYAYSVPGMFNGFAISAGISIQSDFNAPGGYTVLQHTTNATTQNKITSKKWDYVVVQDNLGNFAGNVGSIGSSVISAHQTLINQIKANDSCTRIIFFAGWGPVGGTSSSDNTNACINRIHSNMILLNNNFFDEIVSPIGKAWITSMSQLPSVNLFHTDNMHASAAGAYITAATIFTTIFKKDITNLSFNSTLVPSDAQALRTIAYNTVKDPTLFSTTNLSSFTPAVTVNGTTLTCNGAYPSYQWYLNNSAISGATSSSHTATANGLYKVTVTDSMGCARSSFEINVTSVAIDETETKKMIIKQLSGSIFEIVNTNNKTITINDIQGKTILNQKINQDNYLIDLSGVSKGIYIISVGDNNKIERSKIFVQ